MWFLTIDPFVGHPFSSQNFPSDNTAGVFSKTFIVKNISNSLTYTNCLFMRLHFSIGGYDYRGTTRFRQKYPFQLLLKSFLLIMCIDALESTTNSLSSGFNVDAGRHLFSEDEKNAALSCSFNFDTFLASFHAASRAPCSCHSVSSCERSSNFGALGLRSCGSPGQM